MRTIDADALIERIKETWCKNCDEYGGIWCRACNIFDLIGAVNDMADSYPAGQNETDG